MPVCWGLSTGTLRRFGGVGRRAGLVISVIGPPCRPEEAWHGCEPAFTLIPDFGLSGLVAMAVASVVLLWSVAFVHRRHGGLVLVLLSAILFLVGGGFTTLWFGILAGIAGTRIGGPLPWWRARVPPRLSRSLARLWPWLLVAYLGWWAGSWAIAAFAPDLMLRLPPAVTIATPVVLALILLSALAHATRPRAGVPNQEEVPGERIHQAA